MEDEGIDDFIADLESDMRSEKRTMMLAIAVFGACIIGVLIIALWPLV